MEEEMATEVEAASELRRGQHIITSAKQQQRERRSFEKYVGSHYHRSPS